MTKDKDPVDSTNYNSDYFLNRCGGIEFFNQFGFRVLKPIMQAALNMASLKTGMKVADIGCGRGELVAHLIEKKIDAIGFDYSEDAIRIARQSYPAAQFTRANLSEIQLTENYFDRIFILGTIEHLTEKEIDFLLQKTLKALKSTGLLIMSTCTNQFYYKVWTYSFRCFLVGLANRLGMSVKNPSLAKSDEDKLMHINEIQYFSLKKRLISRGFNVHVVPFPNPKLILQDLYSEEILNKIPYKKKNTFEIFFYQIITKYFPLSLIFSRAYLAKLAKF